MLLICDVRKNNKDKYWKQLLKQIEENKSSIPELNPKIRASIMEMRLKTALNEICLLKKKLTTAKNKLKKGRKV